MVSNDRPVTLTQSQLQSLLETAAEAGARKALSAVGLHDDRAVGDVLALRGLLDAWRSARATAWSTAVRLLTTAALAGIAAAVAASLWQQR